MRSDNRAPNQLRENGSLEEPFYRLTSYGRVETASTQEGAAA